MLGLLLKLFVKNADRTDDPDVRAACGAVSGLLGIALNAALFAVKLLAGFFSGSIAVTADAFNNLSDAGSSIITMIGFRLSRRRPDPSHPFGHGRVEYVAGLVVSMTIIVMGFELGKSSAGRIAAPEKVALTGLTAGILAASAAVKAYMFLYNRALAKKIDSAAVRATAMDSLSDCAATLAVLGSMIIGHVSGLAVDGWAGLAVAAFILYSGVRAAMETINPLLGEAPDPELTESIRREVLAGDYVLGIHDLIVHDYGPGRLMISLHAEVPAEGDILVMHDAIDRIEQALSEQMNCEAVIHMDPIVTDDGRIAPLRAQVSEALKRDIDGRVTVHDFRMVEGATHTNLIFDAVVPFDVPLSDGELETAVAVSVRALSKKYVAVVRVDRG